MKCVFCDYTDSKISLTSLFLEDDLLCSECRKKLILKRRIIKHNNLRVETFYEYDGMFKSLLIQYKECYDEILKDVFLYKLTDYINIRYFGYHLALVPSSRKKLEERGFNHLELMFEKVKLKRVEGIMMKQNMIQEGKNVYERKKMTDNYVYTGKHINKVLIVDDVMTTGSSLQGVYNALNGHADKIKVLSLAYKSKDLHY